MLTCASGLHQLRQLLRWGLRGRVRARSAGAADLPSNRDHADGYRGAGAWAIIGGVVFGLGMALGLITYALMLVGSWTPIAALGATIALLLARTITNPLARLSRASEQAGRAAGDRPEHDGAQAYPCHTVRLRGS